MYKNNSNIDNFKNQLSKKQIIDNLIAKNLKGGSGKCPPPVDW